MTPEELREQMQQLVDGTHPPMFHDWGHGHIHKEAKWKDDPETGHCLADKLLVAVLRELGYGAAMDIYEAQERWMA